MHLESNQVNSFEQRNFNGNTEPPIGDYPQIPLQWTGLKDPIKYWDQQGRRNYGEIVHEHYQFTNIWGVGTENDMSLFWSSFRAVGLFLGTICVGVWAWSP